MSEPPKLAFSIADFRGPPSAATVGQSEESKSADDHRHPDMKQLLDLLLRYETALEITLPKMKTEMQVLQHSHITEKEKREILEKKCNDLESGQEKWKEERETMIKRSEEESRMRARLEEELQHSRQREKEQRKIFQKRCQDLEGETEKWKEEREEMTMQLGEAARTRARLIEELEKERNARIMIEVDFKCRELEARELLMAPRPEFELRRHGVPSGRFIGGFAPPFPRLQ